jgi:branched-chain amino acid aminotransferase
VEIFVESLRSWSRSTADWVPSAPETSLYFRPFMIATKPSSACAARTRPATTSSPARPARTSPRAWRRCRSGCPPITRAAKGGTGAAKCGGNYAASLLPQQEAAAQGCSQVLFLDPVEGKYLEELGGMNVFFVFKDGRLVTPALSGSILEGITREILQLGRDRGMKVEERKVGRRVEAGRGLRRDQRVFACGTAAVVTPIGQLKGKGFAVGDINARPAKSMSLRKELTDIQYGRLPDRHGWLVKLHD